MGNYIRIYYIYDMIYKLNHIDIYIYIYGSLHYTQLLEADYGWFMVNHIYIYEYDVNIGYIMQYVI